MTTNLESLLEQALRIAREEHPAVALLRRVLPLMMTGAHWVQSSANLMLIDEVRSYLNKPSAKFVPPDGWRPLNADDWKPEPRPTSVLGAATTIPTWATREILVRREGRIVWKGRAADLVLRDEWAHCRDLIASWAGLNDGNGLSLMGAEGISALSVVETMPVGLAKRLATPVEGASDRLSGTWER